MAGYFRATQLPDFNSWKQKGIKPASVRKPLIYSIVGIGLALFVSTTVFLNLEQRRYDQFLAFYDNAQYQDAVRVMEKQLAESPDDPGPHWNLALVAEAQGDFDAAAAHLRRYLAFVPDDPEGQDWLRLLEHPDSIPADAPTIDVNSPRNSKIS